MFFGALCASRPFPAVTSSNACVRWEGPFPGGRHPHMVKGEIQISIPNPQGSTDIGVNLLKLILSQAGISREEWIRRR